MHKTLLTIGLHTFKEVRQRKSESKKYECENCGLVVKQNDDHYVADLKYNRKQVQACPKPKSYEAPKRIRIHHIQPPFDPIRFKTVTPGSVHVVTKPPGHFHNDEAGVWIRGFKGDPIKVFTKEFEALQANRFERSKPKRKFTRAKKNRFSRK